jgi:hypothetical protein|tara:strand:+ start:630 stop:1271 length:642 start_codon:yes stop_codon:yes gene_type:complete
MAKKPLFERLTPNQTKMIVEKRDRESGDGKDLYMKGIFIQGGVKNQNDRIYPIQEIGKAVETINERLQEGQTVLGEADHPEELTVNLDRVSHIVEDMWMDGPNGYGKLKIIPTPMGNIISTLLESGAKLGVSSRGSGNVNESGHVSDFDIVTVDIVAQPSAPEAYPKAIRESLWNMRGGYGMYNLAEAMINDKKAQKYLQEGIMKFIEELNKK